MMAYLQGLGDALTTEVQEQTICQLRLERNVVILEVGLPLSGQKSMWGTLPLSALVETFVEKHRGDAGAAEKMARNLRRLARAVEAGPKQ
jgi:hypothetical protein